MGRQRTETPMQKITIINQDGEEVSGYLPVQDPLVPRKDEDGTIPEFVNVSGKIQNIRDQPDVDVLTIKPWQILRGAQFRNMADKTKAWPKDHAPFRERVRTSKGLDKKYLLTVDQAVADVSRMVGITLDYGRFRLRDYRDHGKIVEESRVESEDVPIVIVETERDDRPKVINAIADRQEFLDDTEQKQKARGYV